MDGDDETLKAELQKALAECQRLRDENAKLRLTVVQSAGKIPQKLRPSSEHSNNHSPSSSSSTIRLGTAIKD